MEDRLFTEASLVEGTANRAKREVVLDLIREGFGNKRDNHYYGREVLQEAYGAFEGAKMYIDHLDPEAARKMNGMPRSVKDLGGRILETELVTDDEGRTVIRGRAKIAQPWLWELIENDPGLLGVSINAWGKAKSGSMEGRQARIVEGISKVGSVDWVTEAGAGGKVVSLVEAQLEQEQEPDMDSDLNLERLAEERPDLYEDLVDGLAALAEEGEEDLDTEADYDDDPEAEYEEYEDEDDEDEAAEVDEGPDAEYEIVYEDELEEEPALAESFYEADFEDDDDYEDEDELVLTEAELEADFADLDEYVEARAQELAEAMLVEAVAAAVQVVQEQYEDQMVEMAESFNYEMESRDQRDKAARIIEATDFKSPTQAALKAEFHDRVFEAEVDEDGEVITPADEVLTRAVRKAIDDKRKELSTYTEARVTGAGETGATTSGSDRQPTRMTENASINNDIDSFLGIAG
jgi:hypothetical protein